MVVPILSTVTANQNNIQWSDIKFVEIFKFIYFQIKHNLIE